MADIDEMSDDELDAFLATDRVRPEAGPGRVEYGWALIIAGLFGGFASLQLLIGQRALEADPYASLTCDVNELLACSTFLTSWEGSILGFSNSYLGIAGFGVMMLLGAWLLVKRSVPSVAWVGILAASALATLALFWFQYTSFTAGTLCPWCLVIWAVLIPFIVLSVGQSLAHLTGRTTTWRFRWALTGAWLLAVTVFAFVYLYDSWALILGW